MAKVRDAAIAGDEPRPASEIVRGNVNRKVERAPSFVSVYANDVQLQTSPWDVRLTLGAMAVEPVPNGDPIAHVLEVAEVRMSLQLAKRVAAILRQQVEAYESRFGVIPQPPED